jgi:hypothetical protein
MVRIHPESRHTLFTSSLASDRNRFRFEAAPPNRLVIAESKELMDDESSVKYTAEDAKKRAPAWARAPGRSLEETRSKWFKPDAPAGLEYAFPGTRTLKATKNLSALLVLELVEAADVEKAVRRALPALSDELFILLTHILYEMKQTYIKGRPSSGKAYRVEANLESASRFEAVLKAWDAQRISPLSATTLRIANFIRDVASDVARPTTKEYSGDCVAEAIASGALESSDLPDLRSLVATTYDDIQAPPCTKYQSLRIALRRIKQCADQGTV